jgi:ABC-2 type transport system ATP-binding protein
MIFQSRLYPVDQKSMGKRIDELIHGYRLEEFADRKVFTLSGGIKRRLDIAMSMVSHPRILFLDEPTTGLDVES